MSFWSRHLDKNTYEKISRISALVKVSIYIGLSLILCKTFCQELCIPIRVERGGGGQIIPHLSIPKVGYSRALDKKLCNQIKTIDNVTSINFTFNCSRTTNIFLWWNLTVNCILKAWVCFVFVYTRPLSQCSGCKFKVTWPLLPWEITHKKFKTICVQLTFYL